ncbi:ABC transporter ATP-binding protein [Lachnospiraceae bacterium 54-53]
MRNLLCRKFALSKQGADDLIKGTAFSALADLSLMLPVFMIVLLLKEYILPFLLGEERENHLISFLLLGVFLLAVICFFQWKQYTAVFLSTYSESAVRRTALAEKLRKLPLSFFGKRNLSDLTNTVMGDCANLEHAFSHAIPQFFGAVISTIITVLGMMALNWKLGIALFWVLPVAFFIVAASKRWQDFAGLKHISAMRDSADSIQECLELAQDIKICNQEEAYFGRLESRLDAAEKAHIKSELVTGSTVSFSQMFLKLGFATVIYAGTIMLLKGSADLFAYLVFLIAASRVYDPLAGSLSNLAEIFHVRLQIRRMQEIESQPVQNGSMEFTPSNYDIEFKNVSFQYQNDQTVLRNVSFTARQGEITALVGPSGGGKSTTARLAARLWDASGGEITLGGTDISAVDTEVLLQNYVVVFQDVVLFNDTIMENIRLGKKDAGDEEVMQAARAAMCEDFIQKLPKGYQTMIGENGASLSGGEKQRLSIARALLKNAPIVILDEATASLDPENESLIQQAISRLTVHKTVIMIAHRLRTVVNADKIVVIENGEVREEGNHEALIKLGGVYSKLYHLQNGGRSFSEKMNKIHA